MEQVVAGDGHQPMYMARRVEQVEVEHILRGFIFSTSARGCS